MCSRSTYAVRQYVLVWNYYFLVSFLLFADMDNTQLLDLDFFSGLQLDMPQSKSTSLDKD